MPLSHGSQPSDPFLDRKDAGQKVARALADKGIRTNILVLALPRGGVPVGYEVARELKAPMDVWLVRKLGVPGHEELAMGALASGGAKVMNDDVVGSMRLNQEDIERVAARELKELQRREREYRGDRPFPVIEGKTVIVVDDGLATGASMRAALRALHSQNPGRAVVAVPVGAPEVCRSLSSEADDVVCLMQPRFFNAVGHWYMKFTQTTDQEVRDLLELSRTEEEERS